MQISLENIAHGTRAYMQDGKVISKPSKEMRPVRVLEESVGDLPTLQGRSYNEAGGGSRLPLLWKIFCMCFNSSVFLQYIH